MLEKKTFCLRYVKYVIYLLNFTIVQWFPTFLMPRFPKISKFVLAPLASKFTDFFKNNLN